MVVATKVYGEMGPGPNDRGASRGHIMDRVAGQPGAAADLDHIDLYQIHGDDPVTPIEETLRALDDLVSQGLVRYVGVLQLAGLEDRQGATASAEAKGYARFETVQAYYSIAGRDLERELVPMMTSEKLGLMVWSPLAGGLLSGKFGPDDGGPRTARGGSASTSRRWTATAPGTALRRCAADRRGATRVSVARRRPGLGAVAALRHQR